MPARSRRTGATKPDRKPDLQNALFSPIRTVTVGSGFSPDLLTLPKQALAGFSAECEITAGREFHPALRISG